ncbi:hypothetical protein LC593_00170 [Nostoc sp. CHAB 5844]|nr:hypothetical protein [Nostoc sp. CHAB 5844]
MYHLFGEMVLRTPFNGILGYAQILQRSKHLNEDERSRIDVIYQCDFFVTIDY